jgi:drug/metabolite transporter (DMT)-like permease
MDGNLEPDRTRPATRAPTLAILLSTLFWGTLWIPLRHLDEAGLGGPWATAAGFTLPLLVVVPFGLVRWRRIAAAGWPLAHAGFLMAACFALYAEALLRGSVARVILLFYLTPAWSTLLARAFLGDRITGARLVTIALGLVGMGLGTYFVLTDKRDPSPTARVRVVVGGAPGGGTLWLSGRF